MKLSQSQNCILSSNSKGGPKVADDNLSNLDLQFENFLGSSIGDSSSDSAQSFHKFRFQSEDFESLNDLCTLNNFTKPNFSKDSMEDSEEFGPLENDKRNQNNVNPGNCSIKFNGFKKNYERSNFQSMNSDSFSTDSRSPTQNQSSSSSGEEVCGDTVLIFCNFAVFHMIFLIYRNYL